MSNIYLISEDAVRSASLIGNNVDSAFLRSAIQYAQNIDLQEVIGTKMLKSIESQVQSGTWKSAEYQTLLDDYIQPYLVQQIMSEIVVPLQVKFRNAGTVMSSDSHYQTVSINDSMKVRDEYAHKASFLAGRIVDYIKINLETFYEDVVDLQQFVGLSSNTTKSPIFFPKNNPFSGYDVY